MIDYKEVLRALNNDRDKLKQQIVQLDIAIKTISRLVSTDQIKNTNSFTNLTIRQAIRCCLETEKEGMRTSEIAKDLLNGGIETTSKNFRKTVYNTLTRCDEFFANGKLWILKIDS